MPNHQYPPIPVGPVCADRSPPTSAEAPLCTRGHPHRRGPQVAGRSQVVDQSRVTRADTLVMVVLAVVLVVLIVIPALILVDR